MKIERAWLRIIVSVIVGGIAAFAFYIVVGQIIMPPAGPTGMAAVVIFLCVAFLVGPFVASVLTPKEVKDGHTRCGKCGYILKGLTEPRCSECGERI